MPEEKPIVKEITVNASLSKVWKAITDKDEMKKWYFDLKEFKPEVGFEFRFMGGPSKDRQYLHICEIIEVEENNKLKYSWRYDGYPGKSFVTFELFEEGKKTKIKLTHEGLETSEKKTRILQKRISKRAGKQLSVQILKIILNNNCRDASRPALAADRCVSTK